MVVVAPFAFIDTIPACVEAIAVNEVIVVIAINNAQIKLTILVLLTYNIFISPLYFIGF